MSGLKLNIIDDIKITKVRDWSIHFKHCGCSYLLHLSQDGYEEATTLYEINNGKLNPIHSEYDDYIPELYLINGDRRTKDSQPYNQIDTDKFIYDLTWNGFVESKFSDDVKLNKSPIYQKKCEIERLMKEIELLERMKL